MIDRAIVIVVDGFGVGALPDADDYGDVGADTLRHVADAMGGLKVPTLERLGLGYLGRVPGVGRSADPDGAFGRMASQSKGKDSISGHWELCGIVLDRPFPTYPEGFPRTVIEAFEDAIGRPALGNRPASGTRIIEELGAEHLRTGSPIVYTSADSVFQLAAHEQIVPIEVLYGWCRAARKLLKGPHAVARVIARPFIGEPGRFVRTPRRRDFALLPPDDTLLDRAKAAGQPVVGVGKIEDLFSGRGLTRSVHGASDEQHMTMVAQLLKMVPRGLIVANLGDFDTVYAHRQDVRGWARHLESFDRWLGQCLTLLSARDVLCVTGDHGNDPTSHGTDHSREYVPLLLYGPKLARGVNLGIRRTLADLGQTLAEALGVGLLSAGESFLPALSRR